LILASAQLYDAAESTLVDRVHDSLNHYPANTIRVYFVYTLCFAKKLDQFNFFTITVKVKFHYASWFEAGSKPVADRFEAGRRPASNLFATSFEPASVMEFGFNGVKCDAISASLLSKAYPRAYKGIFAPKIAKIGLNH